MRPKTLDEMKGQGHLLGPKSFLRQTLEQGRVFSVIFWGAPGSGKTTLARLFALYTKSPFESFSAVTSGLKDLREIIKRAKDEYQESGRPTILFVDEIHRFNKAQQDAFLPHVESGLIILIGATTQNPSFEVIPPLLSRARVMTLQPLTTDDLKEILLKALQDKERGLGNLDLEIESEALEHLADLSSGDARAALNNLEIAAQYLIGLQKEEKVINLQIVETALEKNTTTLSPPSTKA